MTTISVSHMYILKPTWKAKLIESDYWFLLSENISSKGRSLLLKFEFYSIQTKTDYIV